MWSSYNSQRKLHNCSQMCITVAEMHSRSTTTKFFLKNMFNMSAFCWTTHSRRRQHSSILRSMIQCTPLIHDCLSQLFHGFKLPSQYIAAARLPHRIIYYRVQVWTVYWLHRRLYEGDMCALQVLDDISGSERLRTVLLQSPMI